MEFRSCSYTKKKKMKERQERKNILKNKTRIKKNWLMPREIIRIFQGRFNFPTCKQPKEKKSMTNQNKRRTKEIFKKMK